MLLYHFSTLAIASLPAQLTFLKSKLTEWGYENEDSVDPTKFTDDNLSRYAAVAMINTCFEPFGVGKPGTSESEALKRYVQKGGGLFGTHCATVTFQSAKPPALYNEIIGGRGGSSNFMGASTCTKVADHPSTAMLPATFPYNGNFDEADFVATDSTVLVKCKWSGNGNKEVSILVGSHRRLPRLLQQLRQRRRRPQRRHPRRQAHRPRPCAGASPLDGFSYDRRIQQLPRRQQTPRIFRFQLATNQRARRLGESSAPVLTAFRGGGRRTGAFRSSRRCVWMSCPDEMTWATSS